MHREWMETTRGEQEQKKTEEKAKEEVKNKWPYSTSSVILNEFYLILSFLLFFFVLDSSHLSWLSRNCPFSCSCDKRVCRTRSSAVRTGVLCVYLPAGWVPPDIVSAWHPSLCYDNDREKMMMSAMTKRMALNNIRRSQCGSRLGCSSRQCPWEMIVMRLELATYSVCAACDLPLHFNSILIPWKYDCGRLSVKCMTLKLCAHCAYNIKT